MRLIDVRYELHASDITEEEQNILVDKIFGYGEGVENIGAYCKWDDSTLPSVNSTSYIDFLNAERACQKTDEPACSKESVEFWFYVQAFRNATLMRDGVRQQLWRNKDDLSFETVLAILKGYFKINKKVFGTVMGVDTSWISIWDAVWMVSKAPLVGGNMPYLAYETCLQLLEKGENSPDLSKPDVRKALIRLMENMEQRMEYPTFLNGFVTPLHTKLTQIHPTIRIGCRGIIDLLKQIPDEYERVCTLVLDKATLTLSIAARSDTWKVVLSDKQ